MTDTILIYDDEPARVAEWRRLLRAIPEVEREFEVEGVDNKEFVAEIEELEKRRRSARNGSSTLRRRTIRFDTAAILVIDYDLLRTEHSGYLTGEAVAYLARCYSQCGIIVGLNQFGENPFDLTLLGHPQSYADLNIGSAQLHNRGLWTASWAGFRPWQWPLLPEAHEAFSQRVTELEKRLDTLVVQQLGLSEAVMRTLPRMARDFLAKKEAIEEVTFRTFALSSGQGFRSRDKPLSDEQLARVAAARVARWVEGYLLPGQDILVDAPHLAYRYPSLLAGEAGDLEAWNRTARLSDHEGLGLRREALERFAFPTRWASRPVWSWGDISTSESIKEVKDPWSIQRPPWVFCEDLSRFVPIEATREFVAEVESPFARRYVSNPQSAHNAGLKSELLSVDYRPQERLYL